MRPTALWEENYSAIHCCVGTELQCHCSVGTELQCLTVLWEQNYNVTH